MASRRRSAPKPKKRPRRGSREVLPKKKRASYTRYRSADGRFAKRSPAKVTKKRAKRRAAKKVVGRAVAAKRRAAPKRPARASAKRKKPIGRAAAKKAPKKAPKRPLPPRARPKKRLAAPKLPVRSPPRARAPKKRATPARRAAVTRALQRFLELPSKPRRLKQVELQATRRRELVATLDRAGFSEASIRARIGWITRRRNARGRTLADAQARALGRAAPLHGGVSRENWNVLRAHLTQVTSEFQSYIEDAEDMGVGYDEAVDRWFSPNAE